MRRTILVVLGFVLGAGLPALAQEPLADSASATVATEGAPAAQPAVTQAPAGSGLPQRAAPPRTMEAQWPIFALFAATWVAIVGYLLLSGRNVSRLAARLAEREEGR